MKIRTESDQIFLLVVAQSAPPLNVMDLEAYLRKSCRLRQAHLLRLNLVNARRLLVNLHQVIGPEPGFRGPPLQELIERTYVVPPPVLSCPC
jgi:hypothetical protein